MYEHTTHIFSFREARRVVLTPLSTVMRGIVLEPEHGEHQGPRDAGDWGRLAPDEA